MSERIACYESRVAIQNNKLKREAMKILKLTDRQHRRRRSKIKEYFDASEPDILRYYVNGHYFVRKRESTNLYSFYDTYRMHDYSFLGQCETSKKTTFEIHLQFSEDNSYDRA